MSTCQGLATSLSRLARLTVSPRCVNSRRRAADTPGYRLAGIHADAYRQRATHSLAPLLA